MTLSQNALTCESGAIWSMPALTAGQVWRHSLKSLRRQLLSIPTMIQLRFQCDLLQVHDMGIRLLEFWQGPLNRFYREPIKFGILHISLLCQSQTRSKAREVSLPIFK